MTKPLTDSTALAPHIRFISQSVNDDTIRSLDNSSLLQHCVTLRVYLQVIPAEDLLICAGFGAHFNNRHQNSHSMQAEYLVLGLHVSFFRNKNYDLLNT